MARRDYNQHCAAARALDVVGDRWTLLLVRELLVGPRRYTDLLQALPGIGTNLLAARLKELGAHGVLRRERMPPPAASSVYELTERGRALEPIVVELARWGLPLLGSRRRGSSWRAEWSILALRATFRSEAAAGLDETYQFDVDGQRFYALVRDGAVETGLREAPKRPAVTITADADRFLAVAAGELGVDEAIASGAYRVDGDRAAFERCATIFGLPPAA